MISYPKACLNPVSHNRKPYRHPMNLTLQAPAWWVVVFGLGFRSAISVLRSRLGLRVKDSCRIGGLFKVWGLGFRSASSESLLTTPNSKEPS